MRLLTRRFVVLVLATFLYFVAMGTLVPTLPRYVKDELHGGGFQIGLAVGIFALSAGVLRPFAGRLGDQRGRRLLVVGGSAIFGIAALGYVAASTLLVLVIARFVAGVGEAGMWVGSATTSQDLAPPHRRAPVVEIGVPSSFEHPRRWVFRKCRRGRLRTRAAIDARTRRGQVQNRDD